ncbi:MAG: erythromycin esterase family protein [Akkermansiaceae bacterium]|nr:erythromycin esterase family protein [Akkermansiaceae bacterium]
MERISYIPKTWDLPGAIRKRLGSSVGRQRLMNEDGHLLLILHQLPKEADDEVRTAVLFWRNPTGDWKSSPVTGGLAGLETYLTSYRKVIHELDERVENAKTARQYFEVIRQMYPLQRATRHMAEVLQATRQAMPEESRIINMRDQAADLERAVELVAADAKAGMEFTLAESANQHAISAEAATREAKRLNRLAAFFLSTSDFGGCFWNEPTRGGFKIPKFFDSPSYWRRIGFGRLLTGLGEYTKSRVRRCQKTAGMTFLQNKKGSFSAS